MPKYYYPYTSVLDAGSQAVREIQASSVDPVKVPVGLVMWAWAKKFKDSLQALVRVVQQQEGAYKYIEGVELKNQH